MARKPYIKFPSGFPNDANNGEVIDIWVAKYRNYLPWKASDAIHTPQWKTFIADAIAKNPQERSADEILAIKITTRGTI